MRDAERQLIRLVVAGDRAAIDEFVRLWQPRITAWTVRHAHPVRVEEYVQEVWAHLVVNNWQRVLQWEGLYEDSAWNSHSLESYLKTITHNKLRDLQRADGRQLPNANFPFEFIDGNGPLGRDPEDAAEGAYLMMVFQSCFGVFTSKDQRLLSMWREGHRDAHTATELNTNPNNIQQRRFYLLNRLRACLREKLPGHFRDV